MKTETYACDVCGSKPERINFYFQVIFTTEQTEGRSCDPYLSNSNLDLCAKCMGQVLQGNYIFAHGAQGINTYYFKDTAR